MSRPEDLSRAAAAVAACALAVLLLSGCGQSAATTTVSALRQTPPARLQASSADAGKKAGSAPGRAETSVVVRVQTSVVARRLAHRLKLLLRVTGWHTGAQVIDVGSGAVLYAHDAEVARPPASVEKIYTSVAAFDLLGATARLRTTVFGVGHLGRHGVWHGNLYLRGGGDPTFGDGTWNRLYMGGYGPTAAQLASQLGKAGIHRVSGWVYGDESLFDSDRGGPATRNRPDTPDYGGEMSALVYDHGMSAPGIAPAAFAAHELVLTMRQQAIGARSARQPAVTPRGAVRLARVFSPPLSVLLRLMDVPSDDLIADLLAKQLSARAFGFGSLAGGAIEIRRVLKGEYDISPAIHDGSGLDRADRSTPAEIVTLLSRVSGTPAGAMLTAALPVVGREGTVAGVGGGTYAVGHCVAKTGTLDNVTNLAGYCDARGGHTVAFALMVDGPPNAVAMSALSSAVGAIAAY